MPGGYGSSKNSIKIGVFWDGIEISGDGSEARITDPHINIDRGVTITDTSNNLTWSGGTISDGSDANINVSGSGEKRIKTCTATWRDLEYGSTDTSTFSASFSGINYAGGTLTVSKTITYPARAYLIPTAPTLTAAATGRVSTTTEQIRVQWVNNPVSPSAPYSAVYVERADNGGAWTNVSGDLASTTTSWTDALTVVGHQYQYRVFAKNSTGSSAASALSALITTTPPAPTGVVLTKVGTNITVDWTNTAAYYTGTQIEADRGGTVTTYTVASGITTWEDPAENPAVVQQYTLKHYYAAVPLVTGATFTAYSEGVDSAPVALENPPNAPTVTLSEAVLDATLTAQVISFVHNPVDASAQTQAEVRWRVLPAGGYTTVAKTTEVSHTITSGTLSNNVSYGVQARTRGSHATYGPWSDEISFATSTRPVAAITAPTGGSTVSATALTITLGFTDTGGSPDAAAWQIELWETGGVAALRPDDTASTLPGTTDDVPYTIPFPLEDGQSYDVKVRARDAAGLWSAWATYTYPVVFADPAAGTITDAVCSAVTGQVDLSYMIEQATATQVAAVRASIQRLTQGVWVEVCSNDFSGTATLLNLATNQSFETASGTVETRRNIFTNPALGTDATAWTTSTAPVVATSARVTGLTGYLHGLTTGHRLTVTTGGASGGGTLAGALANSPVTVGATYTASVYAKISFSANMRLAIDWKTSGGAAISTTTGGTVAMTAGVIAQLTVVAAVAPATAAYAVMTIYPTASRTWAVSETLESTGLLLEESPVLGAYFDGTARPNMLPNSTLTDATGWDAAGSSVVTAPGDGTLSVVTSGTATGEGVRTTPSGASAMSLATGWANVAVEINAPLGATMSLVRTLWNSGGTLLGDYATAFVGTGTWQTVSAVDSVDTAGAFARFAVWTAGAQALTFEIRKPVLRACGAVRGLDLVPSWVGTANASASILTGTGLSGVTLPSTAKSVSSLAWAESGSRSLRVIPVTTSTDSYAAPGGDSGALRFGMVADKTYTVLATVRLDAAQTGSPGANVRGVAVRHRIGAGSYTLTSGTAAPNVAGEFVSRLTFTLPAGTTDAAIRLYNGSAAGAGDVWFDNLMLVEGTYTGPYLGGGLWTCSDLIPPLGGPVDYRVVTTSAIPTDNDDGAVFTADCMIPASQCVYPDGMRLYLNAGPTWETQAVIIGDPAVSEAVSREKVLVTPVGRQYPIELLGIAVDERYALAGVVARDSIVPSYLAKLGALRADWLAMALMPAPICYRDPFGKRIFGSIGDVQSGWDHVPVSPVSATIVRTVGGDV